MEVACAYLSDPGWRDESLRLFKRRVPQIYESLSKQPQGPLTRDFLPALYEGDPRFGIPPRDELEAVTMDDVREWLEPHLREAPLTVCLVGDLDVEGALDAAARTFGVLPQRRPLEPYEARREAPAMKAGLRSRAEIDSSTPKSLVYVTFPTHDGIEARDGRELNLLARVLNDRVRLEIRERLGATYSPSASSEASRVYPGVGRISISALSDPTGADSLVDACLAVADDLVERGVTDEELKRLKEPLLASLRDSQRSNGWWLQQLSNLHARTAALDESRRLVEDYESLDAEQLTALARRYLDPSRASVLVVHPKDA
ncbi:MAG: M16 family metallopeptidase, partial [Planctomycetota bacterium JB042]